MREQPQLRPLPIQTIGRRGVTAIGRLPLLVAPRIRAQAVVPELVEAILRVVDGVRDTPQPARLRPLPRRRRL